MRPPPLSSLFRYLALAFLSYSVNAQDILRNTGTPLHIDSRCTEDDQQWGGLTCSIEEPCPIYLELSAVVPNGKKIVVSGNLHSGSTTLYSILLLSEDGGETWKEPAKRIRGASLDQLQFIDFQSGWAAGETLTPLPRDPFVLGTDDGGATWQKFEITEEGTAGSVQRFWFDSPKHGEMIVDAGSSANRARYSQFETETGGQGWNIKGSFSAAPVIRRAPSTAEHPDWRVRASADGKSYLIEKRDGERWTSVSAFAIGAGECKPPALTDKEPEQLPDPDAPVKELNFKTTPDKTSPDKTKPAKKKKNP